MPIKQKPAWSPNKKIAPGAIYPVSDIDVPLTPADKKWIIAPDKKDQILKGLSDKITQHQTTLNALTKKRKMQTKQEMIELK